MGYLLSVGVIAFQLAILVTIIGAARLGRKPLILATLGWTGFTLFGSIFTAGLLLLQLVTILLSYNIGRKLTPGLIPHAAVVPEPKPKDANRWLLTAILIIAGIATGKFLGRESAEADIERLKEVRAARSSEVPVNTAAFETSPRATPTNQVPENSFRPTANKVSSAPAPRIENEAVGEETHFGIRVEKKKCPTQLNRKYYRDCNGAVIEGTAPK